MKIFLDSCVLFDSQVDSRVRGLLNRVKNRGDRLITSITVLGETLSVCLSDQDRETLHGIIDLLGYLDIQIVQSSEALRMCCYCIEETDVQKRFTPNDKTHVAYALVDGCDVFLTTDRNLTEYECIRGDCPISGNLKLLDYDSLRQILDRWG